MTSIWISRDPEFVLVSYLKSCEQLRGIRVGTKMPPLDSAVKFLVQVQQTGGTQRDKVTDIFQMTVTCWAETLGEAMRLGVVVRGLLEAASEKGIMSGVPCYSVESTGVTYPDPDPVTGAPRATTTFQIALRGTYERK